MKKYIYLFAALFTFASCGLISEKKQMQAEIDELKNELAQDKLEREKEKVAELEKQLEEANSKHAPRQQAQASQSSQSARLHRAVINDPDGYTNVRGGKSANTAIVGVVYEGQYFYVQKGGGNWWKVYRDNSTSSYWGYMHNCRIRLLD